MTPHPGNRAEAGLLSGPLRRWLGMRLARAPGGAPATWVDVAIFKVDRVGDFVLALGALRLLLRHFGEERCLLFVSVQVAELAAAEFPRTPRHILPLAGGSVVRGWWPLRRRHRHFFAHTGFRTVVNLRHWTAPQDRLVLSWLHRENSVALAPLPEGGADPFDPAGLALPSSYPPAAYGPWSRELLAHRAVVRLALGREVDFDELRPRLTSVRPSRGDYLLVCPFSTSPLRDYPVTALAAVLRDLTVAGAKPSIVLSGTPGQQPALAHLARQAGLPATAVRTGDGLMEFVRLVAGARAVLALDSAPAHLATALDLPAVVLLGGGHHGMFCPWGGEGRRLWLTHPMPCFGCNWHCLHPEALCLTQIEPARVVGALQRALSAG